MWSGASVAHLTQTQMALSDLSYPFFQTTDLKTISLICNIEINNIENKNPKAIF